MASLPEREHEPVLVAETCHPILEIYRAHEFARGVRDLGLCESEERPLALVETVEPEELDMALAVLPRNQGRMGDTLISLGLVSPVDIVKRSTRSFPESSTYRVPSGPNAMPWGR